MLELLGSNVNQGQHLLTISAHNIAATTLSEQTIISAAKFGGQLVKAKAQFEHGEWEGWLAVNCTIKIRQTQSQLLQPFFAQQSRLAGIGINV